MPIMSNRIHIALKSFNELGFKPVFWIAFYRAGLYCGLWRHLTPIQEYTGQPLQTESDNGLQPLICNYPLPIPDGEKLQSLSGKCAEEVIAEANEIVAGKIRLFGDKQQIYPLKWQKKPDRVHWSAYELHRASYAVEDVKLLWEPARFEWAYTLCRAFMLSGDEKYPQAFWKFTTDFLQSNPPNCGPQWTSAQEVALRLLALLFSDHVFSTSPFWKKEYRAIIARAVVEHANRIIPTLSYARAQKNNHLLSEALGLYAAGISLPQWPDSSKWVRIGWKAIHQVIAEQISDDGTYIQHSCNYHRLMLQEMSWAQALARTQRQSIASPFLKRVQASIYWLHAQIDPETGHVPNLGHNDGAYIFPLACCEQDDYRPVIQCASDIFLDSPTLPAGIWNETSLWAGYDIHNRKESKTIQISSPAVHRLGNEFSWGTLRAVNFNNRPAHADQLHVDLWWQGNNIAMDAGTFSYNNLPPWNNTLKHSAVHNTVTIQHTDQMTSAGRFLWLDWAQAKIIQQDSSDTCITAQHDGYRRLGVLHRRSLLHPHDHQWKIIDHILPVKQSEQSIEACIHWLCPDHTWEVKEDCLLLTAPYGRIKLSLQTGPDDHTTPPRCTLQEIHLIRAGESLVGDASNCTNLGWISTTYYQKKPALSFRAIFSGIPPFSIVSNWKLLP